MTISVKISPHTQQRLEALASKQGKPLETYVNELIERTVRAEEPIDTILAPFRQGFSESGMTEEEATNLLDTELKAVRAARHTKSLT
jgi:predicted transcriptional regulator